MKKTIVNMILFIFLLSFSLLSFCKTVSPNDRSIDQKLTVRSGKFVVEPSTLICLGFEWYIEGDANHNAAVEVTYRKKGDLRWRKALPLLRIQNEKCINSFYGNIIDYITPNLFAGSIMDLQPDTAYECKFIMSDPDGVHGEDVKTVTVRTRPKPESSGGGKVYHVYPYDYGGLLFRLRLHGGLVESASTPRTTR